ncbi:MAG TPA: membrane protein insertase YidC [Acidobacteriaceae bacterium]
MAEIRNPNQQGSGGKQQDSRSFLIFALVFLVMLLALQYFRPKKPEPQPAEQKQQSATAPAPTAAGSASAPTPPTQSANSDKGSADVTPAASVAATSEQTTTVENENYRIVFSNRGAEVKSWVLKRYEDDNGKPLDLVNPETAAKFGYPLSLYSYDAGLRQRLATALYVPSTTGNLTAPAELTFDYAGGGLVVKKTFRFDASYVIHITASVTNNGSPLPTLVAWPAGIGDQSTLAAYSKAQFDTSQNGKFEKTATKKVSGGATLNGPFDYAGISDLYFGAIFLPDQPEQTSVISLNNGWSIPKDPKQPKGASETVPLLGAAVGSMSTPVSLRVFAGPKVISVLSSVKATAANATETGPNLEPILNFGWFGWVAKPLFAALRFTYDHIVPNWGWSILILTLVLNLAMLPTRITMMKSALKMQRIQPEMQQIKERYKKYKATDPRRQDMNKEIMELQRREGVNMFGGCLPMLLQYPLLYGFYEMLENVIELRHAHWLWLHDLAAPDALHILPIFVILTMFTTSYLSPSPGVDPAQQKMMAFMMPLMFGFIMLNIGSGVALYWAASNLITTGMQIIMNRTGMGKQMKEIAAKRAAKKLPRGGRRTA